MFQFWKTKPGESVSRSNSIGKRPSESAEGSLSGSYNTPAGSLDREWANHAIQQTQQQPPLVEEEHRLDSLQIMEAHVDIVRTLLIIDKDRIASSGDDGAINLWEIHLGICLHTFRGHTQRVVSLVTMTVAPTKGKAKHQLVSASADKTLLIWDLDTLCPLFKVALATMGVGSVRCLVSFVGELLLSGGSYLTLWDRDAKLVEKYSLVVEGNDIHHLLTIDHGGLCYIISVADHFIDILQLLGSSDNAKGLEHVTQFPKQKAMVRSICQVADDCFAVGHDDGAVSLWGIPSFLLLVKVPPRLPPIGDQPRTSTLATAVIQIEFFSKKLIFFAAGRSVFVYDRDRDQVLAEINAHSSFVRHFCFYQHLLVTCSEDGVVRFWSLAPFLFPDHPRPLHTPIVQVGECVGHSGPVEMAVSYADGVISCGADSLVIAWRDKLRTAMRRRDVSHLWNKAYS